jgi:hypothetical protein
MSKRTRTYLLILIGIFLAFVMMDSQGVFDSKSWIEIPHGSHSHYLPRNYAECNPPLTVGDGPTRAPGPGETIDCSGNIVPEQ